MDVVNSTRERIQHGDVEYYPEWGRSNVRWNVEQFEFWGIN